MQRSSTSGWMEQEVPFSIQHCMIRYKTDMHMSLLCNFFLWWYVTCPSPVKSLLLSLCRCVSYTHSFTPVRYAWGFVVLLGLHELRSLRSTATQLSDADKCCHLCNIIQGRMRTPTCSWSHRQTNKSNWGYTKSGARVDKIGGERSCTLWGACRLLRKVLHVSSQISTKSAQAREREAPCPLQGSRKTAEWT